MEYGICPLSIIPVRAEASSKTEQVTQLLFGESFEIIGQNESGMWIHIRIQHDQYEGWVEKARTWPLSKEEFDAIAHETPVYAADMMAVARNTGGDNILLPLGSRLPQFSEDQFTFSGQQFNFHGKHKTGQHEITLENLQPYFGIYLNAPYLWGGRHPIGIDCSGLTQVIYQLLGVQLPRDAYQQAELGGTIDFVAEAQAGDLAFFDNEEGHINHVGFVLDSQSILHSAERTKIDKLDHQGIFDVEKQKYTHKLRIIKRYS